MSRVDLKTGAVTATIKTTIGNSEGSIVAGAGSIWLMTDAKGTLARFDPATNAVVAEIYVASGSYGLAFGEDAVWVTSTEHSSVARVDPHTNLVVETIPVGKSPRFIAAGGGAVWTLNQGDGSVSRIDPKTNKVVATIEVGVPGRRRRDRGRRRIGLGDRVRVPALAHRSVDQHGRAAVRRQRRRRGARRPGVGLAVEPRGGQRLAPRSAAHRSDASGLS